ncbi:MAG: hypothetical protein Q9214_002949, partial [Letrouitia sp. 1 TL-2023]
PWDNANSLIVRQPNQHSPEGFNFSPRPLRPRNMGAAYGTNTENGVTASTAATASTSTGTGVAGANVNSTANSTVSGYAANRGHGRKKSKDKKKGKDDNDAVGNMFIIEKDVGCLGLVYINDKIVYLKSNMRPFGTLLRTGPGVEIAIRALTTQDEVLRTVPVNTSSR